MKLHSFKDGFKAARKKAGFTQEGFVKAFVDDKQCERTSLQSVRNWEQGRATPDFKTVELLCEFFHCDMDYLFGNINCPTHDIQFIQDKTGLSEEGINKLIFYNDNSTFQQYTDALNLLFPSMAFESILCRIQNYLQNTHRLEEIEEQRRARWKKVESEHSGSSTAYNWPYSDELDSLYVQTKEKVISQEFLLNEEFKNLIQSLPQRKQAKSRKSSSDTI